MKFPDYSVSFTEPVVCVKPGRVPVLKLCIALLALIGVPAMGVLIWAEVTGFNLNHLPWAPRIALAAVVILCAYGIYTSVQERQVKAKLSFYKDSLVLFHESYPSLWSENAPSETVEIKYSDVKQCIYSTRRMKVTLDVKRYLLTHGDAPSEQKGGSVTFSTLGAMDTNFASLLEKHSPLKVLTKN